MNVFPHLAISWLPSAYVSRRVFSQNLSYENEFDLYENENVGLTHFHMSSFTQSLVSTQRQNLEKAYLECNRNSGMNRPDLNS